MTVPTLSIRMNQVTQRLRDVVIRPLGEADYLRAHTDPMSKKRMYDGFTLGATYLARHSHRNILRSHMTKGIAQALPIPALMVIAVVFPMGIPLGPRLEQEKVRSQLATLEDTVAFNLKYARLVAEDLVRDDRSRMLKEVHGTSRDDLKAWAITCFAAARKVQADIDTSCERIRESRLIQRQMEKLISNLVKVWSRY